MTAEEETLHLAAYDALTNFAGRFGVESIVELLRSPFEIDPLVRSALADALEDGRMTLGHGKRGRPSRPKLLGIAQQLHWLSVGQFILGLIDPPKCPQKAAVSIACEKYKISDRTAKDALALARRWQADLAVQEAKRAI